MKKQILIGFLLIASFTLVAQSEVRKAPITIGYFGHALWHPGVKVGTQINLKALPAGKKGADQSRSLFLSPQIGWYTYPNVQTGLLVNAEFGYQTRNNLKGRYSAFSLGLGFLNQAHITSVSVNLSDGNKERTIDNRGWLLPTVNYEFGNSFSEKVGWYSKLSYGYQLSSKRENTTIVFLELGLKFQVL